MANITNPVEGNNIILILKSIKNKQKIKTYPQTKPIEKSGLKYIL